MKFKNNLEKIRYDTQRLYEWAVKYDVQDCDIEIQYRNGGGYYEGTDVACLDDAEVENRKYGKIIGF